MGDGPAVRASWGISNSQCHSYNARYAVRNGPDVLFVACLEQVSSFTAQSGSKDEPLAVLPQHTTARRSWHMGSEL